jgi:hypothetical protein
METRLIQAGFFMPGENHTALQLAFLLYDAG